MNWLTLFLFCALWVMGAALGMAVRRLRLQEQSMEDAAARVREYLLDRRKGSIECDEEGAMYHLFHEVNSLVAIADAHADSERQAKEFLRNTISEIFKSLGAGTGPDGLAGAKPVKDGPAGRGGHYPGAVTGEPFGAAGAYQGAVFLPGGTGGKGDRPGGGRAGQPPL